MIEEGGEDDWILEAPDALRVVLVKYSRGAAEYAIASRGVLLGANCRVGGRLRHSLAAASPARGKKEDQMKATEAARNILRFLSPNKVAAGWQQTACTPPDRLQTECAQTSRENRKNTGS